MGTEARLALARRLLVTALGCGVLMSTSTAAAAPAGTSFSCRASVARVSVAGLPTLEPFVANPSDSPCVNDSASLIAPFTVGPVTADAVSATTTQTPLVLSGATLADGDGTTAAATVSDASAALGGVNVAATLLSASAGYVCRGGQAVPTSASRVAGVTVNGQTVTVPAGDAPFSLSLAAAGTLSLNQTVAGVNRITRQALVLTTPAGSVVVSEATTDVAGNPCAASAPASRALPPATTGRAPSPGTARLTTRPRIPVAASGRCVGSSFLAIVTGRHIARVAFSLGASRLRTVSRAPFQTRVPTNPGVHRLTARVTFTRASRTPPRTLGLEFAGCSPAAPPSFTG